MALVLEGVLKDILANQIATEVDAGVGNGSLQFETTGGAAEVATIPFNATAFSAATGGSGTITLAGTPIQDTTATGGVIDQFSIFDGDSTKQLTGDVQTSGSDINMTSLTVGVGDTVELTSFSITVP